MLRPFLCFPYQNTGKCLQEVCTYEGYRYWSCRVEPTSHGGTMLTNLKTHFSFPSALFGMNIGRLESWVNFTPMAMPNIQLLTCTSPVTLFLPPIQPLPMLILSNRKISLRRNCELPPPGYSTSNTQPTYLLPLTTHPNSSQCFFCASLSRPLLPAVSINIFLHDLHGSTGHSSL